MVTNAFVLQPCMQKSWDAVFLYILFFVKVTYCIATVNGEHTRQVNSESEKREQPAATGVFMTLLSQL